MRKPFFNKARQAWYVWENGKQVRLAENKKEAFSEWHKRTALASRSADCAIVAVILQQFLDWCRRSLSASTFKWYQHYLDSFASIWWNVVAADVKRYHLTEWIKSAGYTPGAHRSAIRSVQRAFNWAVEEGLLVANPILRIPKPPQKSRSQLLAHEDRKRIIESTDRHFRLVVVALTHLGCRPGEVREVAAENFSERAGAWVFEKHKTDKTGRRRVIHLTPCLTTLTRILAAHRPKGPLFLNSRGRPWTSNAFQCRMRVLRKKLRLPDGIVAYTYRHTFTTDGLANGVGIATMAELLGHRNTSMIDRHYGHLDKMTDHLKSAVIKATRRDQPNDFSAIDGRQSNDPPS